MERDKDDTGGGGSDDGAEENVRVGPWGWDLLLAMGRGGRCRLVVSDALEPDFPIIYVNRGFQDATGYTPDDVVGRNCWQATTPSALLGRGSDRIGGPRGNISLA